MVGSMKSSSDSGAGGLNSAGNRASGAGPGASANRNTSSSSSGTSSSSNGGGLNSAGNRASGAGPGASSNRNTSGSSSATGGGSVGGGLNSAGNRASGAGPGASSNRSTSGNGGGSTVGGGLNSAGNRSSGAGPGASGNRSTTGSGFGSTASSAANGTGGMNSPRGMLNTSLGGSPTFGGQNSPRGTANPSLGGTAVDQDKARQGALAQQARASETKSMNDMTDWGKEVKSVADAGAGWTTVTLNNGLTETRKGDRASRNNNPGNIEAGAFATKVGAVGTDGRFAVFPSKEVGLQAISSLLGTSRYASKTVEGAIASYAPPNENNTAAYAANVAAKIGVSKDTPMSSLTSAQRDAMARAITGVEGNTGYRVTSTQGTDHFASTYLGGQATSPASTASPSASRAPATSQRQNDPSGLPAGTYRGYDPSGLPPDAPAKGPVPSGRPSDPVSAVSGPAPTTQPTGQFPDRPRSLGEKIAAGVIDAGGGMLPGIGMGVSLINGGLALTGNATLGERVVDSFMTGKNAGTPADSSARSASGNGNRETVVKDTSTVPKQTESFEDRYIKFVDPTVRPTPGQRWDYGTTGYS